MKKIIVLTSVLALAACGGGSGGNGHAVSNQNDSITAPDYQSTNGNDNQITKAVRQSNMEVSSSFSNEEKRKVVAINNYKAANQDLPSITDLHTSTNIQNQTQRKPTTRNASAGIAATVGDALIDAMYENMYYWLVEDGGHTPTTLAGWIQYKHALILAGFIGLDFNNIAEAVAGMDTDTIHNQADAVYAELGTLKTFDGTNIEWFVVSSHHNDKITFDIDSTTKEVIGARYTSGGTNDAINIDMNRDKDTNKYIANNVRIYQYGLNNIECIGSCPDNSYETYDPNANERGGRDLNIETTEPLRNTAEIKEKLLAKINQLYNEGFFHSFHNAVRQDEIGSNNEVNQELIAQRLRDAAIDRVNNWDNETNKIDEPYDINIEADLMTYGHLVGLAYSDFGTMNFKVTEVGKQEDDNDLRFVYGGYKDKKIDVKDINSDMRFNGIVKARVDSFVSANHSDDLISSKSKEIQDNNATLTFNAANRKETLTASFKDNDWYDVTVVKDSTHNPRITFIDNTISNANPESKIDTDYRFLGRSQDNLYTVDNFTQSDENVDFNGDGVTGVKQGAFDIGYYGDKGIPSEAVGFVHYNESEPYRDGPGDWEYSRNKSVNFEAGFGMQKVIGQ